MILQILNKLASTLKIGEKQAILSENSDNFVLREVFRLTYSKQIMFHIKKIPDVPEKENGTGTLKDALKDLENDLASRNFTGHAGRDRLVDILSALGNDDREVLRRVINRDLECGTGTSLANKTWKKLIPETPQCLCSPYSEKAVAKIKFPCFSQLKADGSRGITDLTETAIRSVTRAGNEYQGLDDIQVSLRKIADYLNNDMVIDGEFIYSEPAKGFTKPTAPASPQVRSPARSFDLDFLFGDDEPEEVSENDNPVMKAEVVEDESDIDPAVEAKREQSNGIVNKSLKGTISHEEQKGIIYQVWDLVDYRVYYGDHKCETPYQERLETLRDAIIATGVTNVQIIPSKLVEDMQEAKKDYNAYRNDGKEGSVLKNVDFLWRDARVSDQVKLKNKTPIDLRIVGIYEHKKDPGKVGGFVVEDESGLARCNTGSGLTDTTHRYEEDDDEQFTKRVYIPLEERGELDREFIMANANDYIGAIVEMEVDGLQTSKTRKAGEPPYSFFLPIIKKIRRDKDKPNSIKEVFANLF